MKIDQICSLAEKHENLQSDIQFYEHAKYICERAKQFSSPNDVADAIEHLCQYIIWRDGSHIHFQKECMNAILEVANKHLKDAKQALEVFDNKEY